MLGRLPKLHVAAIFLLGTVVGALIFIPSEKVSATRSPESEQRSLALRLELTPPKPPLVNSDSATNLSSLPLTPAEGDESSKPVISMNLFNQQDSGDNTPDDNSDGDNTSSLDTPEDYSDDANALDDDTLQKQMLSKEEQDALASEDTEEQQAIKEHDKDEPVPNDGWVKVTVESGDNLTSVFQKAGYSVGQAIEVDNAFKKERPFRRMHPGDAFSFKGKDGEIDQIKYKDGAYSTLTVSKTDKGYELSEDVLPTEVRHKMVSMTVKDTLFNASKAAGIPYRLIANMSTLFTNDVDFRTDVRKGDTFTLIYEEKYINGKRVGLGDIIAARYTNKGQAYYAIRNMDDDDGEAQYFDQNGEGKQKAFDRSPVAGARISSPFSPRRYHPKLHIWRSHEGVDLAAPYGTPIHATGYGKVIFVGRKGGYGNVVVLAHSNKISTLYAHMKGFAPSLSLGDKVKRGQVIGYIGTSGLSTGPHVHYEVRLGGTHMNPMTVALPKSDSLTGKEKARFASRAKQIISAMNGKTSLQVALK